MARGSAERMRAYRRRMKTAGMREIRLWVPDTRTPAFKREARRQSLLAAQSESEREALDWLERVQADLDLPPYDDTDDGK